ncbi:MAG: DUF29 domain-containing protein [Snowella sp.]|nr:DUF29 domain-containing protein [Snowella sp.]
MVISVTPISLYEQDFPLWLDVTLEQLQAQDLDNIDWPNLIEEIAALGREQRHKFESYLIQLLKHLLLYQYWQSEKPYCAKGWMDEIDGFRVQLEILLRSKTLYNFALTILDKAYDRARRSPQCKSDLNQLPSLCPYSMAQILDPDFFPE